MNMKEVSIANLLIEGLDIATLLLQKCGRLNQMHMFEGMHTISSMLFAGRSRGVDLPKTK